MSEDSFLLGQMVSTLRGVDAKVDALAEKFDNIEARVRTVERKVWYHSGFAGAVVALLGGAYELLFHH